MRHVRVWAWLLLGLLVIVNAVAAPARADVAVGTRIADKSFPAVHLVVSTYTGDVTVPRMAINKQAETELNNQIQRQVNSGIIASNPAAVRQARVEALAKDPLRFFQPGTTNSTQPVELTGIGTAWSITPDGTMITAAHCVETSQDDLARSITTMTLKKLMKHEVYSLAKSGKFTADEIKQLAPAVQKWYAKHIQVGGVRQKISVRFSEGKDDGTKVGKLSDARVVSKGEGYPGKDYAILKVDGIDNAPTVPIGEDTDVVAGTSLYVAGYTAASTFFPGASTDSINQPALTEGPVSSVKSNDQGVPYFQTQAPAGKGNSGGPVLNEKGEAVGILVAGSMSNGQFVEGQQWVLPIRVAKDALKSEDIKPKESSTSQTYNEALDLFYEERYEEAIPKFKEVHEKYPTHAYVNQFLKRAKTAVSKGQGKKPQADDAGSGGSPDVGWILIAGGGVAVLLLVGVTAAVIIRGRRRARPTAIAQPQAATQPPHPAVQRWAPTPAQPHQPASPPGASAYPTTPARQSGPHPAAPQPWQAHPPVRGGGWPQNGSQGGPPPGWSQPR